MDVSSIFTPLSIGGAATAIASMGFWMVPLLLSLPDLFGSDRGKIKSIPLSQMKNTYDFIVVGAGSSGAVVANRLSEIEDWNVLVLEAGGDEIYAAYVPALAAYMQLTDVDWQYKTEPQPTACQGFHGNRCNWPRGKVIGGCSVLNYMLYVRGNRRDYDLWASLGNIGWDYENVLHYFKKSENNRNPAYAANSRYHGTGGYLNVEEAPYKTDLVDAFVKAGKELGYEERDGNAEFQAGFMVAQGTVKDGKRHSSATAFIRPIRGRKNLHISLYSHVRRILINPLTKRAYGVEFERDGQILKVYARKEVIISSGTVNSAQLLMVSGVGPAEHLKQMGIPVIADLPVGQNLQDHIAAGWVTFLIDKPISLLLPRIMNWEATYQWFKGEGPGTVMGGVEGIAWVKTKYANQTDDYPDIEFHFVSGSPASDGGAQIRRANGLSQRVWSEYYEPIVFRETFSIIPMLLRPRSNGYIRLRSADVNDKPLIYPNYLVDEQDAKVLVDGVKIAIAVGATKAFEELGTKFYAQPFPGCEHLPLWTDDYLACCTRHYSATIYHPTGTCKMGPVWDKTAVVDPMLRVLGISGLRVIDSSIMPYVPSGNTNAPAIMVGEKGADLVKAYWLAMKKAAPKPHFSTI